VHESAPRNTEGAGNAGCALHRGPVCKAVRKTAHEHTGSAEALRHSLRKGESRHQKPRQINVMRLMRLHLCRDPAEFKIAVQNSTMKFVGRSSTDSSSTVTKYDARGKVISHESMIGPSFTVRAGPACAIARFPTSE
jgi:hypothetical protein